MFHLLYLRFTLTLNYLLKIALFRRNRLHLAKFVPIEKDPLSARQWSYQSFTLNNRHVVGFH